MAQPAAPFQSRTLVRAMPMGSQKTFPLTAVAAAGTLTAEFDVCGAVMDRNFFAAGVSPAPTAVQAIGPYLDAVVFSTQIGQMEVLMAVDDGCSFRSLNIQATAASDLTEISGLRVTARYVRVVFTNQGAVAANVEFGVYLRST